MPMTARELVQEGRLREAIDLQERLVLDRPDDADGRLLLTELLLFAGSIDAAGAQLAAIPEQLPGMAEFIFAYRQLLGAAKKRQRLFDDVDPQFLLDPPDHLSLRLQALDALRKNQLERAVDLLDEADSRATWVTGHVDGREVEGVRDGDDLFGPLLELLVDDRYVWIAWEQIERLRLSKPESLRDHLFMPASLVVVDSAERQVHLPALYPDSHRVADDDLRLGRATDWIATAGGPTRGIGQRILTFGAEELTLFDFTQWESGKRRIGRLCH